MDLQGRDWIGQLPAELAGQRTILGGLLDLCEADERIRWLVIGCSLARGAADHLSDLDVAMGVRDEEFPVIAQGVRRAVDRLGDLVDSYHHQLPGVPEPHKRIFASTRIAASSTWWSSRHRCPAARCRASSCSTIQAPCSL